MKIATASTLLCLLAVPCLANDDAWLRTVPLRQNSLTNIKLTTGAAMAVEFPKEASISEVALSDSHHIQRAISKENVLFFKAMSDAPELPAFVRIKWPDGAAELCVIRLSSVSDSVAPYVTRFVKEVGHE
ncbi:MAG: hypothetical protein AB7F35_00915 [Acetobacteraceae bacterium]